MGAVIPRLRGEQIHLESRIVAVADVVEAMTAQRPWRAVFEPAVALDELVQGRGTRYGKAVVDACLRLFREKGYSLPS